jgi:hypothetical protein
VAALVRYSHSDGVEIFRIDADSISADIYYSDKQHAGNEGEGQFHLNNQTYAFHKENYFIETLTYNNLLVILSN